MGKKTDWFPSGRDEQLSTGKNRVTILSAGGPSWNIPAQDTRELSTLVGAADAALAEADIVSLGLKPRDPIHSPGKAPAAHVSVETFLVGRHELGARTPVEFDFGDSGKTAHFAVQIENEGKKGPWGPLVQALIP